MAISMRMQGLIDQANEDIESCANSCDAYSKAPSIKKVILKGSWEKTFKRYIECFAARRRDFVLALSIHTADAVNSASAKIDIVRDELVTVHHTLHTTSDALSAIKDKVDINSGKLDSVGSKINTMTEGFTGIKETYVPLSSTSWIVAH